MDSCHLFINQNVIKFIIMDQNFSIEEAVNKLWDKMDGWMEAIILKLPNLVLAVLIMIVFYFISRGVKKLFNKFLLNRISQKSIQDIIRSEEHTSEPSHVKISYAVFF